MHTSFLSHKNGLYLWCSIVLTGLCLLLYVIYDPPQPKNGGTFVGYTLGGLGACIIMWLAYLGRRKRNFAHGTGTVKGWTSAHVYFGIALFFIVTFHTGFQFGMNIHTLAYLLMCVSVVSGLFGVVVYRVIPPARNAQTRGKSAFEILNNVLELDHKIMNAGAGLPTHLWSVLYSSIERTVVSTTLLDSLLGTDKSKVFIEGTLFENRGQLRSLNYFLESLPTLPSDERKRASDMLDLLADRNEQLAILRGNSRLEAIQRVWLLVHVPVTFALFAALIAHVISVFVYW